MFWSDFLYKPLTKFYDGMDEDINSFRLFCGGKHGFGQPKFTARDRIVSRKMERKWKGGRTRERKQKKRWHNTLLSRRIPPPEM
jgi:hypothetical protein